MVQLAAVLLVHEPLPLPPAILERGRLKTKRLRQLANQPHVLELQSRAPAGGEITPHHAIAVQLQDAALREAAQQRLPYPPRVHASQLGQPQRLRHGVDCLRHDELVGQFCHLPRSNRAQMRHPRPDGIQHRQRPLKMRLSASGENRQRRRLRPDLAARDRCVHPVQFFCQTPRCRQPRRAKINHQHVRCQRLRQAAGAKHHLLHHLRRGQVHTQHPIANRPRQLRQRPRPPHAGLLRFLQRRLAAIPHHQLRPCRLQMPCHRPAHVAEPGKADDLSVQRGFHGMILRRKSLSANTQHKRQITH